MSDRPLWSLCHATARLPWGWKPAHDAWRAGCADWSQVEYILGVDTADQARWPEDCTIKLAENPDRQCAVDGWNATGRASTGRFLITVADDLFPPERWDSELLSVLEAQGPDWQARELMIEVRSGTSPADDEWMRCQLHSFITRPWYERRGGFFDPRFEGMYADVWETEVARAAGVMVDARHLTFQHRHWIGTNVAMDEIYQRQNARARYDRGLEILGDLRREAGR